MIEEVKNDNEQLMDNQPEEQEVTPKLNDITEVINTIDDAAKMLEMQRQLLDADEQLNKICTALGINVSDRDLLKERLSQPCLTSDIVEEACKNEDSINEHFFTREDGSIITMKKYVPGTSQYDMKKEIVSYIWSFYDMEHKVKSDIAEMTNDIKEFKDTEIADMSASVANALKDGLRDRKEEAMKLDDEVEKTKRLRMLTKMESAITFDSMLELLEKNPNIIDSIISDFKKPTRIADVGKRYKTKLNQKRTISSLFGCVSDDIVNSFEKKLMHPDDYVEGYENLFVFFLVRFFSMEDWQSSKEYTKELHNACVVIITNAMSGTLDVEIRDEVVANATKIWDKFKTVLNV